ncbi:MAG: amidohydrolase family protein [Flavobacteriaceae bacterium]|nr:amidohydrolase family protein [Flavobacteriaceae bacterium]
MFRILILGIVLCLVACQDPKTTVDLIVSNAKIYTVDEAFSTAQSMAVSDGKIVAVGTDADIDSKYEALNRIDAQGNTLFPGLIDAHAHFYNLGVQQLQVDLVDTQSVDEIIERLKQFAAEKNPQFLIGRGWDQNDWEIKEFPTKEMLDAVFPDLPVALTRIDGHSLWVNSKALDMAGITKTTKVSGGEVVLKNGQPSGILVDAPMQLVRNVIPELSRKQQVQALIDAQDISFANGLTTISDAGLSRDVIELIDSLQKTGDLKMRLYAMVSNNPDELDYFLEKGVIKTDRLHVRSVKVYADGALGSRGACLHEPYSDLPGHYGAMITTQEALFDLAAQIAKSDYQMNTHAIGDSANTAVIKAYKTVLKDDQDRRWRIEHAQVVRPEDFDAFSLNILPSIQPTHATSDMYWATDRLGDTRIKGAYAFKTLLDKAGKVALGTDFPVEKVSPFLTFYAATTRQDTKLYPDGGFMPQERLSREETLRGMTIWAAYSNFEETEKGSLEVGKVADFVLLDKNLMEVPFSEIPETTVLYTVLNGEIVFKKVR